MSIPEETILEALRQVRDPELQINIVDLGLIYSVEIDEQDDKSNVSILMTMTSPACPYAPEMLQEVRDTLRDVVGMGAVDVQVTLRPPWTPDRMTEDARDELGMF